MSQLRCRSEPVGCGAGVEIQAGSSRVQGIFTGLVRLLMLGLRQRREGFRLETAFPVLRMGSKHFLLVENCLQLIQQDCRGAVKYDGGTNGHPDGHVSVNATPQQIGDAIVPHGEGNPLHSLNLKPLQDPGTYRAPNR